MYLGKGWQEIMLDGIHIVVQKLYLVQLLVWFAGFATSSKANSQQAPRQTSSKQTTCRAWNRIIWVHMKTFPRGSPWCPGHPLRCHTCLQFATDLLKPEHPKNSGETVKLAVQTPPGSRSENIECWALETILLDSIVDIKQHKQGTSDSFQWYLQPAGLQSPWRRIINLLQCWSHTYFLIILRMK